MIAQRVHLHEYDWVVDILYDARPKNADEIVERLWDMGCPEQHLYKAGRLLRSGVPNEGLTYTDHENRHTLVVVGHTTDIFQCINSLEHESNHLEMHICEHFGIDPYSEKAAYLSGDIKEAIARNAWLTMRKIFLCLL